MSAQPKPLLLPIIETPVFWGRLVVNIVGIHQNQKIGFDLSKKIHGQFGLFGPISATYFNVGCMFIDSEFGSSLNSGYSENNDYLRQIHANETTCSQYYIYENKELFFKHPLRSIWRHNFGDMNFNNNITRDIVNSNIVLITLDFGDNIVTFLDKVSKIRFTKEQHVYIIAFGISFHETASKCVAPLIKQLGDITNFEGYYYFYHNGNIKNLDNALTSIKYKDTNKMITVNMKKYLDYATTKDEFLKAKSYVDVVKELDMTIYNELSSHLDLCMMKTPHANCDFVTINSLGEETEEKKMPFPSIPLKSLNSDCKPELNTEKPSVIANPEEKSPAKSIFDHTMNQFNEEFQFIMSLKSSKTFVNPKVVYEHFTVFKHIHSVFCDEKNDDILPTELDTIREKYKIASKSVIRYYGNPFGNEEDMLSAYFTSEEEISYLINLLSAAKPDNFIPDGDYDVHEELLRIVVHKLDMVEQYYKTTEDKTYYAYIHQLAANGIIRSWSKSVCEPKVSLYKLITDMQKKVDKYVSQKSISESFTISYLKSMLDSSDPNMILDKYILNFFK